jgi:hypothetical protein
MKPINRVITLSSERIWIEKEIGDQIFTILPVYRDNLTRDNLILLPSVYIDDNLILLPSVMKAEGLEL